MVVLRILRWLFGYVVFRGRGPFPERFLNLAAREELNLWDVRCSKGELKACVSRADYKQLRPIARKAKLRLRVQERHGLHFHTRKYQGRAGLLVGAVLFVGVLTFLSQYVWDVQVHGAVSLTETQVEEVMSELGIHPGVRKKELNAKLTEQKAMVKLPELSWIAINLQGSVVNVEIKEREVPPEFIPQEEPCNMVATQTGQVIRLEVYTGTAAVNMGDAVVKGQLLINSVVEDETGNGVLKHASGKVYAATHRELTIEVPLSQMITVSTGNVMERRRISVFGIDFPISVAAIPGKGYLCKKRKEPLMIGKARLPVTIYTETWTEQIQRPLVYTEEQAQAEAHRFLEEKEKQELGEARIVHKEENVRIENGTYILMASYDCEENIAQESAILVK